MKLLIRAAYALLFAITVCNVQSAPIEVIVINGDPAPDGDGTVFDVGEPIINDAGQVAFGAKFRRNDGSFSDAKVRSDGTTGTILFPVLNFRNTLPALNNSGNSIGWLDVAKNSNKGLLLSDGLTTTELIRRGDPMPSDGGRVFGAPVDSDPLRLNDAGQVAFVGTTNLPGGASSKHGVFLVDNGGITTIAETGEIGPDDITRLQGVHDKFPQLNNHGQVAVVLNYDDRMTGGLFLWEDGVFTEVAMRGEPTPLINPNGTGTEYENVDPGRIKINDHGAVAFSAVPEHHNTARWAVFQRDAVATLPLYLSDSFSPVGPSGPPAYLAGFNDLGQVAFSDTRLVDGVETSMIIRADRDSFEEIVRNRDAMPSGEGTLFLTPAIALNDKGQIAFMAATETGDGLLFYDDDHGLTEIIRSGASLLDGIVETIEVEQRAPGMLNNCGQVVFRFYLEDGRRGIAVADPLYYERQPISGRVVGRSGSQSRGLSDAVVRASSGGQLVATAPCDARGNYSFGPLPAGDYILNAVSPSFGLRDHFVTLSKDEDLRQNFYLSRDGTRPRITGTLSDATEGFGIGGASITALIGDTTIREYRSYGSGWMSTSLPGNVLPATVTLRVSAPGYLDSETQIDVDASREFTHDIALVRDGSPTGTVRGRVIDSGTGLPLEDILIYALHLDGGVNPFTRTAADGTFALPGIATGPYRVWASIPGRLGTSEVVIVNADQITDLPLALELTPDPNGEAGTLISEVTEDEAGAPEVRLSWPAHWIDPVVECSNDLQTWIPVEEELTGNSHTVPADGAMEYFRVRYEP